MSEIVEKKAVPDSFTLGNERIVDIERLPLKIEAEILDKQEWFSDRNYEEFAKKFSIHHRSAVDP